MKKIVLVMAILFASLNLQAAKVAGPDENGRIYNTAYFDVLSGDQPPVLDVITYSKRIGTFDWLKLMKQMDTSKSKIVKIRISTRIEVPSEIKTDKVYVTEGEFYNDLSTLRFVGGANKGKWYNNPSFKYDQWNSLNIRVQSFWNDKLQGAQDVLLVQTKKDAFGNKYIDYKLVIEFADYSDYHNNDYMARSYKESLSKIKFKIAPKSRTFQSKWVEPKIYVLDE